MAETTNFFILYDLKQESIPDDEKWAARYDKFVKRVPAKENTEPSEDESESMQGEGESVILLMDALNNERISRDELWPLFQIKKYFKYFFHLVTLSCMNHWY